MGQLLAWNNLIFYIPIAVGVLLALSAAVGLGHDADHDIGGDVDGDVGGDAGHDIEAGHEVEAEADHDVGGDSDNDAGHDTEAKTGNPLDGSVKAGYRSPLWVKILSLLGFGKVPLTLVLMFATLIFGATGVIMNSVLSSATKAPASFAWLSVAVACLMMLLLTGRLARLVARVIPSTETYTTTSEDLVGTTGEIVLAATREFGTAQVRSRSGDLFQITCRSTEEDKLAPGTKVLVVSHDASADAYQVIRLPE